MKAEDTCSQPGQCGQLKARLDHTILQLEKIPYYAVSTGLVKQFLQTVPVTSGRHLQRQ